MMHANYVEFLSQRVKFIRIVLMKLATVIILLYNLYLRSLDARSLQVCMHITTFNKLVRYADLNSPF